MLACIIWLAFLFPAGAVQTGREDVVEIFKGGKMGVSAEGALLVSLTNKNGSSISKGYLVHGTTTDSGVSLTDVGDPDIMGVVYDTTCADGATCWIAIQGIADVYFGTTTTHDHIARMTASGDTGAADGVAISEPVPTSPFATDKHFQEIGHVLEDIGGAGLAKTLIHFN